MIGWLGWLSDTTFLETNLTRRLKPPKVPFFAESGEFFDVFIYFWILNLSDNLSLRVGYDQFFSRQRNKG